ncbi:MAG: DUF3107 domain-containing protein [Scrofimicrobium sp.]
MKLVLNLRDGIPPLALDVEGDEETILETVRNAINKGEILDLTDAKGERVLVPASAIGYALVPTRKASPVGFGRM